MRTRNILAAMLVATALCITPSCDIIEECGSCEQVTEDKDGNEVSRGTALLLCGDELREKDNAPLVPLPDGGVSYWVCN